MTRRPGLSLTEVLVALFILALGVIAIQTMFPLAASQLLVAVKEDRSALAAFTADASLRSYWKSEVAARSNPNEPFYDAFDNPGRNLPNAQNDAVSYPVILDPMGCAARSVFAVTPPSWQPAPAAWFGDGQLTLVRRSTLVRIDQAGGGTLASPFALRTCSLVDGMGYDEYGVPTDDREFRYNWFWILQRTSNADPSNKKLANLTVVVFDKRAHMYAPAGSEEVYGSPLQNPYVPVRWVPGSTQVDFVYPATAPELRPGSWVMDATVGQDTSNPPQPIRHANMYRVVRAEQQPGNIMRVDLETPVRRTDGGTAQYDGTLVVVRGVSGVYNRAALTGQE